MRVQGTENNKTVMEELGRRIRGLRVRSSLTQKELAERAGIAKALITKAENGESVRLDTFCDLLRALGCLGNLQVLMPEDEQTPKEMLSGRQTRRRVRHTAGEKEQREWKWGDEA